MSIVREDTPCWWNSIVQVRAGMVKSGEEESSRRFLVCTSDYSYNEPPFIAH